MTICIKKNIINWLAYERYMGCIIYGHGDNNGKSKYMQKYITKNKDLDIVYLDVQKIFLENNLNEFIFELNPEKFINWCIEKIQKTRSENMAGAIVDNIDFLLNLWNEIKQKEFIIKVCKIEKSQFDKPLIIVMQNYITLQAVNETHDKIMSGRIISFNDIEAI